MKLKIILLSFFMATSLNAQRVLQHPANEVFRGTAWEDSVQDVTDVGHFVLSTTSQDTLTGRSITTDNCNAETVLKFIQSVQSGSDSTNIYIWTKEFPGIPDSSGITYHLMNSSPLTTNALQTFYLADSTWFGKDPTREFGFEVRELKAQQNRYFVLLKQTCPGK